MNRRSGLTSRKKILDAAMRVFSRSGYSGASIREIAGAAEISVGGVYLYFRNKEDLYLSLMKDWIAEKSRISEEIVVSERFPLNALSAFLDFHLGYAVKHKEMILMHIREHGFAFGMHIKKRFFRHQIDLLEKIIREGISTGKFRNCNVHEVAKIIMATERGMVLSIAMEGEKTVTVKGLKEIIFYGLLRDNNLQSEKVENKRGTI